MNRTVPLILAIALFMENMDSTMIATALPAIAADVHTSPVALKLALTSYFVSLATFIPISAWMADRYGATRIFRVAIAVFVVGSVLCAVSGSLMQFVGSRFLQGVGGAMMTPVARLILIRCTEKSDLISAMAWLTFPGVIGPLLGPPAGGFITTFFSWHWIFLINVPIGAAGIVLMSFLLPEVETRQTSAIDVRGFLLGGLAAAGIVFGLSVVSLPALPPVVGVVTALLGLAAFALYVVHAMRTINPILDLRLFAVPTFRLTVIGGSVFRTGVGAVPFLLPLMFQLGFGLSPLESGSLSFASAIGAMMVKTIIRPVLKFGGFRNVMVSASLLSAVIVAVNAFFTPSTPHLVIIAALLASGFLRSHVFTSVNILTYTDIDERLAGQASAISSVTQQVCVAIGVAMGGGILEAASRLSDGEITLDAFSTAFLIVAVVAGSSALFFMRLNPDAGHAVSGHRAYRSPGGGGAPE